jgi:hypothetical protein
MVFFLFCIARKQDLDDTVAIHPTSGEGTNPSLLGSSMIDSEPCLELVTLR